MLPSVTLFQCWQRMETTFTTATWTQIHHGCICLNCNWTVNMLSACHMSQRHYNVWSPLGSTRLATGLQLEGVARICPHVTFRLLVWRSHCSDICMNLLVKSMWPLQHRCTTGVQTTTALWKSVCLNKKNYFDHTVMLMAKFKYSTRNS
jgi:hypothetical protein